LKALALAQYRQSVYSPVTEVTVSELTITELSIAVLVARLDPATSTG